MIPDFEIKVTPGSYEEVSERFKTYLRFRFGIDPASVFITGATGSGKSTASISLAIQYVKQGIPALAIDIFFNCGYVVPPLNAQYEEVQPDLHSLERYDFSKMPDLPWYP